MKKKLLSTILVGGILVTTLFGCGKSNKKENNDTLEVLSLPTMIESVENSAGTITINGTVDDEKIDSLTIDIKDDTVSLMTSDAKVILKGSKLFLDGARFGMDDFVSMECPTDFTNLDIDIKSYSKTIENLFKDNISATVNTWKFTLNKDNIVNSFNALKTKSDKLNELINKITSTISDTEVLDIVNNSIPEINLDAIFSSINDDMLKAIIGDGEVILSIEKKDYGYLASIKANVMDMNIDISIKLDKLTNPEIKVPESAIDFKEVMAAIQNQYIDLDNEKE